MQMLLKINTFNLYENQFIFVFAYFEEDEDEI